MERSVRSSQQGRVHLHVFLEFKKAVDWATLQLVEFNGVRPNASPTVARGDNQRSVMNRGHFYCWAWKNGTVAVQTSGYEPWADYSVKGLWIDDLWSEHKLSHEKYLEYAALVRVGFQNRQKQVEAVQLHERQATFEEQRAAVALRLAPLHNAFRTDVLEQLAPWRAQYNRDLDRYSFLVLVGGSRAGKSTLAKSLGRYCMQTVQDATSPDLRTFRREDHDLIIFDNVNDMSFVLDNRALMQANNDVHTLGESRTGVYSYKVWLWRVPIVITVDLSARWNSDEPWIKANCFPVFLHGPCYCQHI